MIIYNVIESHCIFVSLKTSCTIKTRCIDDDITLCWRCETAPQIDARSKKKKKLNVIDITSRNALPVLLCGDMDRYNNDILSLL